MQVMMSDGIHYCSCTCAILYYIAVRCSSFDSHYRNISNKWKENVTPGRRNFFYSNNIDPATGSFAAPRTLVGIFTGNPPAGGELP
jgi:hypothetical protein